MMFDLLLYDTLVRDEKENSHWYSQAVPRGLTYMGSTLSLKYIVPKLWGSKKPD